MWEAYDRDQFRWALRSPVTRKSVLFAAALLALGSLALGQAWAADKPIPKYITMAVDDAGRPDADKQVDADRKPAETVAFAGIKPGETVIDFFPGGGYFTRIFSKIVGPKGHVYAFVPDEMAAVLKDRATAGVKAIAADPAYSNVTLITGSFAEFKVPKPVDTFWTSRNYHDLHVKTFGPADMAKFDKAVFDVLKPGGTFIVLDHAANPGAGIAAADAMHRMDPDLAKAEVTAAGFKFAGHSDILKNPADDHSVKVFDNAVRGKTDQFIFKFTKP